MIGLRPRALPALIALCLLAATMSWAAAANDSVDTPITIGSKTFTESYVLGEIVAQLLTSEGFEVERKLGLGGTLIAFEALAAGSIDLYPEYTGTLAQAVLNAPQSNKEQLKALLAQRDLRIAVEFGFDNSYAIAIPAAKARARAIATISDLADHPRLRAGFSHEFLNRGDGWPALSAAYGLAQKPVGIEHALAYRALDNDNIDIVDAYTTDGELAVRDLRLLEDDRGFFPHYSAVLLSRADLPPAVRRALQPLQRAINEADMRRLNHRVASAGESPAAVAAAFLAQNKLVENPTAARHAQPSRLDRILQNTAVHLKLTGVALALACLVAIPLSLLLARYTHLARGLLYVSGLIQTIPALALLALLIPLVGLGELPAILALFLYSLLPIVRNTLTGLFSVDPLLKQVATGMGLTRWQRLRHIELPLAMPTLLAGVKTAAIISVGTATLAAFVGAGGLGEPIITGLNLNDNQLILEGAIPAALLAITAELLFELLERAWVPAHLRD